MVLFFFFFEERVGKQSVKHEMLEYVTLMMKDQVRGVVVYLLVVRKFAHDLLWIVPSQRIDPYQPYLNDLIKLCSLFTKKI